MCSLHYCCYLSVSPPLGDLPSRCGERPEVVQGEVWKAGRDDQLCWYWYRCQDLQPQQENLTLPGGLHEDSDSMFCRRLNILFVCILNVVMNIVMHT